MRLLFVIDKKDYDPNRNFVYRPSVRGIIIKKNKIAMVHSFKYNYYKFPGGGIEPGESNYQALIREVREEAGLNVISKSIKEYGLVKRIQKGLKEEIWLQDNYYYICDVEDEILAQDLDEYEAEENFKLEFVEPYHAIDINKNKDHGPKEPIMLERENRVLERLVSERYLGLSNTNNN